MNGKNRGPWFGGWGVWGLVALALVLLAPGVHAQVSLVATNVVDGALEAFNTAGTIGVAILTFLVGLGAVMMGWRVARGRGK